MQKQEEFFDLLSFGGVHPDGKERKGYSKDYIHSFSAVMQQSFRFAVFPKQYITFNPILGLTRKEAVHSFQMRRYGRILKMLVGITYDKKTKKHQCIIEEYMKK